MLILGRGGGSIEDLWAFNNERLARAVYDCTIPVISAVGHETDVTICDFVADLRAPTPSAAAEIVAPNQDDVRYTVSLLQQQIDKAIEQKVGDCQRRLENFASEKQLQTFQSFLLRNRQKLDFLIESMHTNIYTFIHSKKQALGAAAELIHSVSPMTLLSRGYTITMDEQNQVIRDIALVEPGAVLRTKTSTGILVSVVTDKEEQENGKEDQKL